MKRGIREWMRDFVPKWLSNRPGLNNGYKMLWGMAVQADVLLQYGIDAVRAWFPGYTLGSVTATIDASTALPYIARSRGLLQGEAESNAAFAARLPAWLDLWQNAGSSEILVQQIQAYLGNTPTVRVVDRAGNWVSIDSSGNITKASAAWNWDSVSNPERAGWWSDLWIIVYPCEWAVTGSTLSSLASVWGTKALGTGHAVPRAAVDAILSLVAQWKGAHCWCVAILWSYDSTLFVPGSVVSGDPDGTWGNWSKYSGGVQVPARLNDGRVRFWVPAGG